MRDEVEEPETKAGELKPPKIKAEDNPWYLLATLYGVPGKKDVVLQRKNRIAWDRYYATMLDNNIHAILVQEKEHFEEELTPYSSSELRNVAKAFAQRKGAAATI